MLKIRLFLIKRFWSFFKGYAYMHRIYHKYALDQSAVILIPSQNKEYTYYAVKYLKQMLLGSHYKKALILSADERVKKYIRRFHFEKYVLDVIALDRKLVNNIMAFYNTNMCDESFIVASLDEPYGRNALAYLNTGKVTKEELFAIAVYNITNDLELWMDGMYEE